MLTEEQIYKLARHGAACGLWGAQMMSALGIKIQQVQASACYYESALAYLDAEIEKRWPQNEASLQDGQNE